MRRLLRRAALLPAVALVLAGPWALPAAAHSGLQEGSPGPGDEVAPGATSLALVFEGVDADGEHEVVLLDADDQPLATGEPVTVDGTTVCAAVDPMTAGVRAVEYSVTADDGHEMIGRYLFEVLPGAGPVDGSACDGLDLPSPQAAEALGLDTDAPPVWLIAGLLVLLVLSAGAATVAVVRSRRAGP